MEDKDISVTLKLLFDEEVWRPVVGYEDRYKISSHGRVWSNIKNIVMSIIHNEHCYIGLSKDKNKKHRPISRLVAEAFLGPIGDNLEVYHINGDKLNNRLNNLEITTHRKNTQRMHNNGLIEQFKRPVLQYDKMMNFIQRFESIREAGNILGIREKNIQEVCSGRQKTADGFIWKYEEENKVDIEDVEGRVLDEYPNYIITKEGEIYSKNYSSFLILKKNKKNYVRTQLINKKGKRCSKFVHVLVAKAYIPNPENKPIVDHINGIKYENNFENLRWVTYAENTRYALTLDLKGFNPERAVNQFDNEGNLINTFSSVIKAAKEVSVVGGSISSACRNKHKCRGFIWKYADK